MAATVENVRSYNFLSHDKIFFDANIWIILNGPFNPPKEKERVYSRAYQEIITQGLSLFINTTVLSEFINRYARLEHELWCQNNGHVEFKQYRSLPEYKPVAEAIGDAVSRILIDCGLVSINYQKSEFNLLVDEFSEGNSDINDLLIAHTCKECGYWLVTDDYDFSKTTDVKILTFNRKYFAA